MRSLIPATLVASANVLPGGYAAVGAAAMAAGVTRTISSAVVAFEITGQMEHALPVLLAVVCAYLAGETLSLSFFDSVAEIKNLPYFISNRAHPPKAFYSMVASEICDSGVQPLMRCSRYEDVASVLSDGVQWIPLLDDSEDRLLLGVVQVRTCFVL